MALDRSVRGDRAGVCDALDSELARRFEHVYGPDHVDPGAGHGVCLAERHLQCGEMDDGARIAGLRGLEHRLRIGDVAAQPLDFGQLCVGHEQARPPRVLAQIECRHRHAGAREQSQRPAADATAGAGYEHAAVKVGSADREKVKHCSSRETGDRPVRFSLPARAASAVGRMVTLRCRGGGSANSSRAEKTALTLRRPALFFGSADTAYAPQSSGTNTADQSAIEGRKSARKSRYRRARRAGARSSTGGM